MTVPGNRLDQLKRQAAIRAIEEVRDGMVVGLGSGSTAAFAVEALAARIALGLQVICIPTSEQTAALARQHSVPLTDFGAHPAIDLTIDGADQIDRRGLTLVKGRGGALLREKIVAVASKRLIIIVDETKLFARLGDPVPLPVEVVPMARSYVARELVRLKGRPVWREGVVTDNGNVILDVHGLRLTDPAAFETTVNQIAGVVTVGLFAHRGADVLLVAGDDGVRTLTPGTRGPV